VNSIGYYIMIALLGAGAAYGLADKGKPKPGLSNKKKRVATAVGRTAIDTSLCDVDNRLLLTVCELDHTWV
jgi:hypothetical protein